MCNSWHSTQYLALYVSLALSSGPQLGGRLMDPSAAFLTCLEVPVGVLPSSRVCLPRAGGDVGTSKPDVLAMAEAKSLGFRGPPSRGFRISAGRSSLARNSHDDFFSRASGSILRKRVRGGRSPVSGHPPLDPRTATRRCTREGTLLMLCPSNRERRVEAHSESDVF